MCSDELEHETLSLTCCLANETKPLLVYIEMNNKTVFLSISVKTLHTGEVKLHAVKTELKKQ